MGRAAPRAGHFFGFFGLPGAASSAMYSGDWSYPEDVGGGEDSWSYPEDAGDGEDGWSSPEDAGGGGEDSWSPPEDGNGADDWSYPEDRQDACASEDDDEPHTSRASFLDLPEEVQASILSRLCSTDLCNVALACRALQWAVADLPDRQPASRLAKLCHMVHTITRVDVKANESIFDLTVMAHRHTGIDIYFKHQVNPVRPPKRRRLGAPGAGAPAGPPWRRRRVRATALLPAADFFQAPFDKSAAACDTVTVVLKVVVEDDGHAITRVLQDWQIYVQEPSQRARVLALHLEALDGRWYANAGRKPILSAASANPQVTIGADILGSLMKTCCMFDVPEGGITSHTGACLLSEPVLRRMVTT